METGITVTIPAEVTEVGECVMPAKLFSDIVHRLPDEMVTVSVDDQLKVSVLCGISAFHFSAEQAQDYPELPSVEDARLLAEIPQRVLRDMIKGTLFSVSEQATRPIHTGILFEKTEGSWTAVATDGFRLALRRWSPEQAEEGAEKFVVPAAALREVVNILTDSDEPAKISRTKLHILFQLGDAQLVCRVLEGEFMDWRKVLVRDTPIKMTGSVGALSSTLERVGLMVNEKYKSPVRCIFGKDTAEFKTDTALGSARDRCTLAGDGKDLEIGFNCRYLLDALHVIDTDEVLIELTNSLSPIILTPADGKNPFTYLILPVRVKSE